MGQVIFVELLGRRGRAVERTRIDAFPASIGRALTNDVVVDDSFVSPRHARLAVDGDGQLYLEDTDSTNGLHRAGSRERAARMAIRSGDVVRVGHSLLRFRSPDGPVPEAIVDDFEHGWMRGALAALPAALLTGLLAVGALTLQRWLETYERVQAERLVADASYTFLFIGAWAGLWSMVSRYGSRDFDFVPHFSFAAAVGVLWVATGMATRYYEFLASPLRSMPFAEFGAEVAVLCLLVFGHLSIATRLRRRRRMALAMLVVVPLAGLAVLEDSLSDTAHEPLLPYPSRLEPLPPTWLPTRSVSEFLADTEALEEEVAELVEEGERE